MATRKPSTPKYARGVARVEAILDAANQVFAEKGYEAATMTEIAARSGTAIGSMYRFFPTLEVLGAQVLERYGRQSAEWAKTLATRVMNLSDEAFTDSLIDALSGHGVERAGAMAVLDAHGEGPALRAKFRAHLRAQVMKVLQAANPKLSDERAQDAAVMLIYLFKGFSRLRREEPRVAARTLTEQRRLVRMYLRDLT